MSETTNDPTARLWSALQGLRDLHPDAPSGACRDCETCQAVLIADAVLAETADAASLRAVVPPPPDTAAAPTTERIVRHPDGHLMVESVLPYIPTRDAVEARLASLAKAWPYIPDHIDGEFDNALSELRRMIEALYAGLRAPAPATDDAPTADEIDGCLEGLLHDHALDRMSDTAAVAAIRRLFASPCATAPATTGGTTDAE